MKTSRLGFHVTGIEIKTVVTTASIIEYSVGSEYDRLRQRQDFQYQANRQLSQAERRLMVAAS